MTDPISGPTPDGALVERLRSRDPAAFTELVEIATPRMLAVARRFMHAEDDALDAVQDAFVSAVRALAKPVGDGGFDGRSQLTTWLHRITVNACLMKLRSKSRRPERSIEELLPTYREDGHRTQATAAWPGGESASLDPETAAMIRQKLSQLPDDFRIVLVMRDIEQMSTEQTAAAIGISEAAVKTRLHRARQALRELLEPMAARFNSDEKGEQ